VTPTDTDLPYVAILIMWVLSTTLAIVLAYSRGYINANASASAQSTRIREDVEKHLDSARSGLEDEL